MENRNSNGTGVTRLFRALRCSGLGMKAAFQHEQAFRQELLCCLVMVPLGLWLGSSAVERALLTGSLFLVLIVELLNSSVEAVVDRVGLDYHALSGRAKDLASAAVLLAIVNGVVIWLLVLL